MFDLFVTWIRMYLIGCLEWTWTNLSWMVLTGQVCLSCLDIRMSPGVLYLLKDHKTLLSVLLFVCWRKHHLFTKIYRAPRFRHQTLLKYLKSQESSSLLLQTLCHLGLDSWHLRPQLMLWRSSMATEKWKIRCLNWSKSWGLSSAKRVHASIELCSSL